MTKTPRNFTVKVFSIEGARQINRMSTIRFCEVMALSSVISCVGVEVGPADEAPTLGTHV